MGSTPRCLSVASSPIRIQQVSAPTILAMHYLSTAFKSVSTTFALASAVTGSQAILDPIGFSKLFGLPLSPAKSSYGKKQQSTPTSAAADAFEDHERAVSYVSLMGVRQLTTGLTLLVFAYQNKWTETATVLSIIGFAVAGTDGVYIARANNLRAGLVHAVPGALIAVLALLVLYVEE